eukprot:TRINITY_DN2303_c0_g1_i7.p3 TRINITY_DN2303_c0_g1~~TRINITY_DN2303_c0_g1_i7.p3  ORF type:complete len:133 (+),score=37.21 TRINITY_DN2303_c0_g1_i7:337-735(+)
MTACDDGSLACTEKFCADGACPTKKSCTLECGTVVPHLYDGPGEGTNYCNTCHCRDGALSCTEKFCADGACPTKKKNCTLECGTAVPHLYDGPGEGTNYCNKCTCDDGALSCTEKFCADGACPTKKKSLPLS